MRRTWRRWRLQKEQRGDGASISSVCRNAHGDPSGYPDMGDASRPGAMELAFPDGPLGATVCRVGELHLTWYLQEGHCNVGIVGDAVFRQRPVVRSGTQDSG